jgi:hypothetical protein
VRVILALFVLAVLAAVCGAPASAAVHKASFTSIVSPNDTAALTVTVLPRARCTISVVYDTTVSHAKGLGPKVGTKIAWSWKVGSSTHLGSWPVTVNCGKSGKLALRLRVR